MIAPPGQEFTRDVNRAQRIINEFTTQDTSDPQCVEKLIDVVGLSLDPAERALLQYSDEKSRIQTLDRTQKSLPTFPGCLKTPTHDDKVNGATTLFVAVELTEGKLTVN